MKTLKNIVIIYDYNYINGGGAQIAILTANLLVTAGYHVQFFSGVSRMQESQLLPEVEQYSTGQYDILTNPSRAKAMLQGIWNKKARARLLALLKTLDPAETVIHLHGWVKALSPSIMGLLTRSRFPLVCTLHDYFAACPNGGFYIYPKEKICHLRPMSIQCICTDCDARSYSHKVWRVVRQAVQSRAGIPGKIRYFILPSAFSEKIYRPYLPSQAKTYVISNPINLPSDEQETAHSDSAKLLVVGRISREKGVHLACEAARRTNTPLTVIGEGDQKPALQQHYPEVEFKGWLSAADIQKEMLRSTALVFPSTWYETQGLVVLEALSAGLPVIVSRECAASEYVDNRNGVTFETNNVQDLSEKINLLVQDKERAAEMGRYARANYQQHPYTTDIYLSQLLDVYATVLNNQ
jgi:glycosyltransferase involved in cell wall biosynthesis